MKLFLAALLLLLLGCAKPGCPCGGCDAKPHVAMVGTCRVCSRGTPSADDAVCSACAQSKKLCLHCGRRLPAP